MSKKKTVPEHLKKTEEPGQLGRKIQSEKQEHPIRAKYRKRVTASARPTQPKQSTKKYKVKCGARFGYLTVLEQTEERKNGYIVWRCQCDCGNEYRAASRELRSGRAVSCKDPFCDYYAEALEKRYSREDFTGRRFGKLSVLGPAAVEITSGSEDPKLSVTPLPSVTYMFPMSLVNPENSCAEETGCGGTNGSPGRGAGGDAGCAVNGDKSSRDENCRDKGNRDKSNRNKNSGISRDKSSGVSTGTDGKPVRSRVKRDANGRILWDCKCDCGKTIEATSSELKSGNRKSCGCLSRPPLYDWVGKRFGRLTVTAYDGKRNGCHYWKCLCDCGTETVVIQTSLLRGHTSSCGCLGRAVTERRTLVDGTCVEILRSALSKRTIPQNNSSGVRGVYWQKRQQRWCAQIMFKGKMIYLGSYNTIGEAATARKRGEQKYFGEFLEEYDARVAEETQHAADN